MRKEIVAIGIILMFIGVIAVSASYNYIERLENETVKAYGSIYWVPHRTLPGKEEWRATVSGDFDVGEVLSVVVMPNNSQSGWGGIFLRSSAPKEVNVTITGPNGTALFKIFFVGHSEEAVADIIPVGLYNYTLVQGSEDIDVRVDKSTNAPQEAGGLVKKAGTYIVEVAPCPAAWAMSPPEDVILYGQTYVKVYLYPNFLPISIALLVCGVLVGFYGYGCRRKVKLVRRKF
jgi:hypothetical protein